MRKTITKVIANAKFAVKDAPSVDGSETEHVLTVIACDPSVDRDGEQFDTKSLRLPVRGGGDVVAGELKGDEDFDIPAFLDHSRSVRDFAGSVRSARLINGDKLQFDIGLTSLDPGNIVYTLANEAHLGNNVSVTYAAPEDQDSFDVENGVYMNAELLEVSVVWRGSNRDAEVVAVKSVQEPKEGQDMAKEVTKTPEEVEAALEQAEQALQDATTAIAAAQQANGTEDYGNDQDQNDGGSSDQGDQGDSTDGDASTKKNAGETEAPKESGKKEEEKMTTEEKSVVDTAKTKAVESGAIAKSVIATGKVKVNEKNVKAQLFKFARALSHKDVSFAREVANGLFKDNATKAFMVEKAGDPDRLNYPDADAAGVLAQAFIDKDIERASIGLGGLWSLITSKTINSRTYRKTISNGDDMLSPAGFGSATVDHAVKAKGAPSLSLLEINVHPYAHIYIYDDEAAEDSWANLYDEMVQELAEQLVRRQDNLILSFAGLTSGAETYEATGIIANSNTPTATAVYNNTFGASLAAAIGKAQRATSNRTLVANVNTIGAIGAITDTTGRPLYSGENGQLSLGILGTLNIKMVDNTVLADNKIVVGDYSKYTGVDRGSMQVTSATEYAAGVDLFATDATAVRGVSRLGGKQRFDKAFVVITGSPAA